MMKSVANLEAPREQVFSVLTDFPRFTAWVPGCKECAVVSSSGNTTDTRMVSQGLKTVRMVLRWEAVPHQTVTFRMVESKDMRGYSGVYRLMDAADGSGTVLITEMEVDAGPMAPKFMVERMTKKAMEDSGNALKQFLKTLPAAKPAAGAPAAAKAPAPAAARPPARVRPKLILQVFATADGYRIWMAGRSYDVKK